MIKKKQSNTNTTPLSEKPHKARHSITRWFESNIAKRSKATITKKKQQIYTKKKHGQDYRKNILLIFRFSIRLIWVWLENTNKVWLIRINFDSHYFFYFHKYKQYIEDLANAAFCVLRAFYGFILLFFDDLCWILIILVSNFCNCMPW